MAKKKSGDSQVETETLRFWANQILTLRTQELVRAELIDLLIHLTAPANLGKGEGRVRLGPAGRWDVLEILRQIPHTSFGELVICSGIAAGEVASLAAPEALLGRTAFDPNSPRDLREFWRIQTMSQRQIRKALAAAADRL